ncbi:MAG: putative rRNA maturation factor [Thermoleophilia bacterium]|nr:putative rRNA maturation factor [Thermoleophilia bacterium]
MDRPDFKLGCDVSFDVAVAGLDERGVQVLVAASLFEAGAEPGDTIEVSVAFVDEARIAEANVEHREVDGPTDVLSFPIDDLHEQLGPGEPRVLGDLLVCPAYVERQVAEGLTMQGDPDLRSALERCVVHGTLHLAGFDHERSDQDATEMFSLEQLVLDRVRGAAGM